MHVVFHIGFHKTASSWLQQVYFPAQSEVTLICDAQNPKDDPFLSYLVTTPDAKFNSKECENLLWERIAAYGETGDKCVYLVSAERLSGYPISGGFDNFRIAERIHSVMPRAKIIVVVREQTAIIRSIYKQMVREGYPGRLEEMLFSDSWKAPGFELSYLEYDLLISKYFSLFGEQKVLTLPYELIRENKEKLTDKLCGFLGTSASIPSKKEKLINRSLPAGSLSLIRWLNHFRRSELNPYPVFSIPDRLLRVLKKIIVKVTHNYDSRSNFMSDAQRTWLTTYYKESNERLKNLVGISLSKD